MTYSCPDCGTRARCPRCRARAASLETPTRPEPSPRVELPPEAVSTQQNEPQGPETRSNKSRRPSFRASVLADLERATSANQHRAPTHTPLPDTLSLSELAERFGVNYQTARVWRTRGVLPPPDWWDGAYPRWDTATADEWWRLRQLRQGGRLSYRRSSQ